MEKLNLIRLAGLTHELYENRDKFNWDQVKGLNNHESSFKNS